MGGKLTLQDAIEEVGPVAFEAAERGGGRVAGRAQRSVYNAAVDVHGFWTSCWPSVCPIGVERPASDRGKTAGRFHGLSITLFMPAALMPQIAVDTRRWLRREPLANQSAGRAWQGGDLGF
jgi:hypothetical protein